jgi:hypothetical protein
MMPDVVAFGVDSAYGTTTVLAELSSGLPMTDQIPPLGRYAAPCRALDAKSTALQRKFRLLITDNILAHALASPLFPWAAPSQATRPGRLSRLANSSQPMPW